MDSQNLPLIIESDKTKASMLLFLNLVAIGGAAWFVISGYDGLLGIIIGAIGLFLFPFAFVLQIRRYCTKEPLARIDENGIQVLCFGFIPWSDVTGYAEFKTMIQVYILNEDHYINKLPALERFIAILNKKFGFSSVTIPLTACSKEQRAELTNALKKRITVK